MAEKKFLYAEATGVGNEYELKEAGALGQGDYPLGAIPYDTTLGAGQHRMVAGDATRTPISINVGTNSLVGRSSSGNVAALSAAAVRTILNVEDGATATVGQNEAAEDSATNAVNFYNDATGSPFANRLNFFTFRSVQGSGLTRINISNNGTYNEIDILEAPSVFNIHGDSNITPGLTIPIMRAAQRMKLIEMIITPSFTSGISGTEGFSFRIFKNTTPVAAGSDIWANASSWANRVQHLDAEGTGYLDTNDSRWEPGFTTEDDRILNSGDWVMLNISKKWVDDGDDTGTMDFVTLTTKYGIV